MKNLIILFSSICLCFTYPGAPKYVYHQPDFTQAHFYSWDSIFVVQEFNTGGARTLQPGQNHHEYCDYMQCTDSVVTYWKVKGKKSDTVSYHKRTNGYWTEYLNGTKTGKAHIVTDSVVVVEIGQSHDEKTDEYFDVKIEYLKTRKVDDIKRKIAHDDTDY